MARKYICLIFLLLMIFVDKSVPDQDAKLKFSPAALPESYLNTGGGSGETFENFYAKTKDIEIDQNLIEKLQLAQQEIDKEENKQAIESSLEESDSDQGDDLFADFSLRGSLFGK